MGRMSMMNTPDQQQRTRLRGFKVLLFLSIIVGVMLQMWTGSKNQALFLAPVGIVFLAYMIPAIIRARRQRRASGARPRVVYPLAFKVVGGAVFLAAVAMAVLFFTHEDRALAGQHASILNTVETAMVVLVLMVAQWQRSIIRRQLGSDWSEQKGLASSGDDRRSRW